MPEGGRMNVLDMLVDRQRSWGWAATVVGWLGGPAASARSP